MIAKRLVITVLILIAVTINASAATTVVVHLKKNADINSVASSLGATILDSDEENSSYLLSVPSVPSKPPAGCDSITVAASMSLPRFMGAMVHGPEKGGTLPWYSNQPLFQLIHAAEARGTSTGRGIIIADIDSQVDVGHPAVRGHLTTGYDFVKKGNHNGQANGSQDQSTASFLDQSTASFLDQSTASFLDQSTASFLDQSTASFLDQSTASFLDQSTASFLDTTSPGHGHGTMVAGILASLAPDAMIMPLRAFDDNGVGYAFQIGKAIRYAVKNGADVINLSLGIADDAQEVRSAIDFATQYHVVVVASVGNGNSEKPQFPASIPGVIGVAATDLYDHKGTFSNFGASVSVTAPGVAIITSYPNGYVVASGTSFSSPIVAAEAALMLSVSADADINKKIAENAINIDSLNKPYAGKLGNGRIDLLKAVNTQ